MLYFLAAIDHAAGIRRLLRVVVPLRALSAAAQVFGMQRTVITGQPFAYQFGTILTTMLRQMRLRMHRYFTPLDQVLYINKYALLL